MSDTFEYETVVEDSDLFLESLKVNRGDVLSVFNVPGHAGKIKVLHENKQIGWLPHEVALSIESRTKKGIFVHTECVEKNALNDIKIKITGHYLREDALYEPVGE